jgi:hypothetical protein
LSDWSYLSLSMLASAGRLRRRVGCAHPACRRVHRDGATQDGGGVETEWKHHDRASAVRGGEKGTHIETGERLEMDASQRTSSCLPAVRDAHSLPFVDAALLFFASLLISQVNPFSFVPLRSLMIPVHECSPMIVDDQRPSLGRILRGSTVLTPLVQRHAIFGILATITRSESVRRITFRRSALACLESRAHSLVPPARCSMLDAVCLLVSLPRRVLLLLLHSL